LPTRGGWRWWWFGRDVERRGGNGYGLRALDALLDLLKAEVVTHLLERREGRRMCEDGAEVVVVLV
jgi:hypothetical protein